MRTHVDSLLIMNSTNSSYLDFPTVEAAMDAVVKMYELKLKELNPSIKHITYDIADLYKYIDSLNDLCGLVLDPSTNKYDPHDRAWIKNRIFQHLKRQAS